MINYIEINKNYIKYRDILQKDRRLDKKTYNRTKVRKLDRKIEIKPVRKIHIKEIERKSIDSYRYGKAKKINRQIEIKKETSRDIKIEKMIGEKIDRKLIKAYFAQLSKSSISHGSFYLFTPT